MVVIEKVAQNHIPAVVDISEGYLLDEGDHPGDTGFLVSGYSAAHYSVLADRADLFYVALDEARVCGFLLAYSDERIPSDDWMGQQLPGRLGNQSFVMIKQICVHPENKVRGVARELYEHLFTHTEKPLFAAIVLEPRNSRSIGFHEKCGFRQVADALPADGMHRGLWAKGYRTQLGTLSSG